MDTPFLRVHAVRIFVRDQEQSLRFYVDQLGFQLLFDVKVQSGDRWVGVAPQDGGTLLALSEPRPGSHEETLIGRPTGVVLLTENVIATTARWTKRGVRFLYAPRAKYQRTEAEQTDSVWGGVTTHFKDLDGNSFALVEFDQVTREIEAQRLAAAARLEAERRAAYELEVATEVQGRLFPQSPPPIRTLEYAGSCLQARQVGGDYFDFINLGHDRYALIAGDIAGKGMPAALLMANLQASLRIHCATMHDHPRSMLESVNQTFYRNTHPGAYATLFFAEYHDDQRRLRYANCGHLPGLLLRNNGCLERLAATATVVGAFEEWECDIAERILAPGDLLALYTDGITECSNDADLEFGEGRLIEALRRHQHLPASAMIAGIFDEVQRFGQSEQFDDNTLIIAKCR